MLDRRRFLKAIVAAAAAPAVVRAAFDAADGVPRGSGLVPDPARILDLAEGLRYRVISTMGERMSDGLLVPGSHDGMAAFPAPNGRIALVRNHELDYKLIPHSAFGKRYPKVDGRHNP